MINITKLLFDYAFSGDELRYNRKSDILESRPIVVWNCTRRCNLSCLHCYSDSSDRQYPDELSTEEAKKMIQDLADFKAPVLLFSGGEPLLRKDLFILNAFAKIKGLRTVISTNGTLLTKEVARRIKEDNFDYVGISLDGSGLNNDKFRGSKGAFNLALSGIRNLIKAGVRVGLRYTITRHNYSDLKDIFRLVEEENIERVCFYHLVYSGRGSKMIEDDLTHQQMRLCIDSICDWVKELVSKGIHKEVLTVDNHTDGAYIYLKLRKENPERAQEALRLLRRNGGNNSGIGIADIDNLGFVHADQFWQSYSFGNVRERNFSEIWLDTGDLLMRKLKDRRVYLKGRCARCKFLDICNGNLRTRAEAVYKDIWQDDPACYLTDEEVGINAISSVSPKAVKAE
ncbi:MAG: radical SAM protein [Candidatus Omnitrophica bacterium]|nr:radical SAM protein [Candidatus Omnitrophota bacterium]